MITPAYSPTATERVLPRLALDFTTGVLDPRVTVTRALNTATRVNSSGYIEGVNADLPRFDYDPVTLAPKGLLIEETRSNLLLHSGDFNNAAWTKEGGGTTPNAAVAPDGTTTATLFTENTANTSHRVGYQSPTTTAVAHTFTVYVKYTTRQWVWLRTKDSSNINRFAWFDIQNGVIGTVQTNLTAKLTNAGNGWYRCEVTVSAAFAGVNIAMVGLSTSNGTETYTGNGTSGVLVWGGSYEAGSFATSYIPTTTTSLTRNADGVKMTGTNFSSWYNQSQGTIVVGGDVLRAPTGTVHFAGLFLDYSNFIRIRCNSSSTPDGNIFTGGSSQMSLTAGNISSNTFFKSALAYATNNSNFALNGTTAVTRTTVSLPSPNLLGIGSLEGASGFMSGHIAFLNYYPQRLLDAEIAAFTK